MYNNKMLKENSLTIKKNNLWKYSAFVLVVVIFIGIISLSGKFNNKNNDADPNNPEPLDAKALIEENDPVLGSVDAEISIIEFSDFQCIFCEKAYSGAIADFKVSSYFKDGKVNLIFKQLPLDTACNSELSNQLHPYACKSAEASLCADEQGKFWEYHDMMFENQAKLDVTSLKSYATTLELNENQFNNCLDTGKYTSEIKKEIARATSAGGRGTPFFIIVNTKTGNSTVISGAYPWSHFETAINSVQ